MSANMVSYDDYVAGWLDSSIHDFLGCLSPNDASAKYALITCLDSNVNVASLRKKSSELKSIASKARALKSGLLLPTELLLEASPHSHIFFGFDEIWFFPSDSIEPKPDSASIVGPARIDRTELDKLGEWMSRCSCSLALGDGEGLNFIVKAHGLVRYLLGHTLEQPQLTVTPFESEPADSA